MLRLLRSLFTSKVSQQSNGHDGLAKAHLIGQNAVQAARVNCHEPVQTNVLVLSQPMLQQKWHLQRTVTLLLVTTLLTATSSQWPHRKQVTLT